MEPEINEMESPNVSNQDERRLNTNQGDWSEDEDVYWSTYLPLCTMIRENDWKGVVDFVAKHPEALTEKISSFGTIFHHLIDNICDDDVGAAWLIEDLASQVNGQTLEQRDDLGLTALSTCAATGNRTASCILVKFNPNLPDIAGALGYLPVHDAAAYGHRHTVQYLISVTAENNLNGTSGAYLISFLILSNLYDLAFDLLKQYPLIGRDHIMSWKIVLEALAEKPLAFASGSRLGRLQRFIYNSTPVKKAIVGGDVENAIVRSTNYSFGSLRQKLHRMLWNALMLFVPCTKFIHEQKVMHMLTVEILRMICQVVVWDDTQVFDAPKLLFTAARFGISEIVNEIIMANDRSIYWIDQNGNNVFHVAILHRQEKVFNLIYRFRSRQRMLSLEDEKGNNMLFLAAMSQASSKVAGAALQMQSELQWCRAVEDLMLPYERERQNKEEKTPREVFTASHKDLVKEGEKWMKDTATSCTIAVSLIITVVFTAVFTVPGGNNDNGLPNFLNKQAFLVFVISDALALFSSITSLLMFLGILTSRYAEEDFLISLPRKLIIGLVTLFFSVASMMVAFGAALYLVVSQSWKWTIIPITLLGCIPVTLFALLQFPFLLDMIMSTYGPSIFGPNQ